MPKTHKINTSNIESVVMAKINSGQIVMKSRWYFVTGAILGLIGLVSFGIIATFLTSLSIFLLKQHGPNGEWRLQQIIDSFPVWVPILAILGIILGIIMLKKYDFSYQKNFNLIILAFIVSILLTAFILDYTGLDNIWMRQGPMMRLYQNNDNQVRGYPRGSNQGRGRMIQK